MNPVSNPSTPLRSDEPAARGAMASGTSGASPEQIPWYAWAAAFASATVAFGVHWDIAWHRSIGRDTFWSPPHVAIYLAAVLAALSSGFQILRATFGPAWAGSGAFVRVLGFRGPLGSFVCAWGGIAMLASAPFDDWWHNAYGLDVKILSPPHVVLAIGILAIHFGALVLIVGRLNRASGEVRQRLHRIFVFVGGMIVTAFLTLYMERTLRIWMHTAEFYKVIATFVPLVLMVVSRASGQRWTATATTAVYSVFLLVLLWGFPLVPAQPKLGPVLHETTHLIPAEFPLLLIVPAFLLDALSPRLPRARLPRALATGLLFLVTFFLVQWPFASFLMSPPARNYLFGARYFDFWIPPQSLYLRHIFLPAEAAGTFVWGMVAAGLTAVISAWCGMVVGDGLRQVQR